MPMACDFKKMPAVKRKMTTMILAPQIGLRLFLQIEQHPKFARILAKRLLQNPFCPVKLHPWWNWRCFATLIQPNGLIFRHLFQKPRLSSVMKSCDYTIFAQKTRMQLWGLLRKFFRVLRGVKMGSWLSYRIPIPIIRNGLELLNRHLKSSRNVSRKTTSLW